MIETRIIGEPESSAGVTEACKYAEDLITEGVKFTVEVVGDWQWKFTIERESPPIVAP